MKRALLLWMRIFLLGSVASPALGEVIPLADPTAPATLIVNVAYATLEVVGTGRAEISFDVELPSTSPPSEQRLPIAARGNRVEIVHPGNTTRLTLRIEVPRRSDLSLESSNGGTIRVAGVEGALEIVNSNGPILLESIGGSVVAATSNGRIAAEIERVNAAGRVSLVTSNAAIDLTLPAAFSGRILAETDTGPIESDFEVDPELGARGLTRLGQVLSGRIGEGGPLVRLRTDNAGIRVHRAAVR